MHVILAKSPFTLELLPPIFTDGIGPDDDQTGIYYNVQDSELDKRFLPNECIIEIKDVSIVYIHNLIKSIEEPLNEADYWDGDASYCE